MEYENENVKTIYSKIATHFDNTRHYKWDWIEKFINEQEKGSTILDLGCGNGRNMINPHYNFIGIDNCQEFITICKKKNLNVLQSDMTYIPLKENIADTILCIASFHHLYTKERRLEALNEMVRLLKPGGKILLSVWSKQQPKKTKRKFDHYGDTLVKWQQNNKIYNRYYYIFKLEELMELTKKFNLILENNFWDCGNEIFIFRKHI